MTRITPVAVVAMTAVATALPPAAGESAGEGIPGQVVTVAGTGALGTSPDGTPAVEADLHDGMGVAVAPDGTMYLADTTEDEVRTVGTDGLLGSVPELSGGESADGEDYTHVWAVAVGADGSLYAATDDGIGVRRPGGGVETLAAGQFIAQDITVGADGTVYVADLPNNLIRAVDPAGTVTTLAGADGSVGEPRSIAVDSTGVVYFTDTTSAYDDRPSVIRRIDRDGTVTTVVGDQGAGFGGDGGPAAEAQVSDHLGGLAVGADDTLYVADTGNDVIRAIGADEVITTVAPVMPSAADFASPPPAIPDVEDVSVGPDGRLYVAIGGMVRMLVPGSLAEQLGEPEAEDDQTPYDDPYADEEPGTVVTVAGADGELRSQRVSVDETGGVYVVAFNEADNAVLVRLDDDGTPQPVTGGPGDAPLIGVRAAEPGRNGVLHLSTDDGVETLFPDGSRVRLAGGIGGGQSFVDGVPATTVSTSNWDLALGPEGLYFADVAARAVYVVEPDGTLGIAGTNVEAQHDGGLDVTDDGTVYVVESRHHQVTAIDPDGSSRVFAGNGESGWMNDEIGDGGPAAEAVLAGPGDVAVDSDGTVYVSSVQGIRRVDSAGTIETVLDGKGDDAPIQSVSSLDFDAHGNLYFIEPETDLVAVLVRPGEMAGPFPWAAAAGGAGGLAVLGFGWLVVRRRRTGSSESEGSA